MIPEHKCGIELHPKLFYARKKNLYKKELLARQKYKCYWCGCSLSIWWTKNPHDARKRMQLSTAELDHIIPRCAGGSNEICNLVASCQKCNRIRGMLYMRGVRFFIIIGQETPISLLERYKRRYSSNQYTRKKYNALNANKSNYRNISSQGKDILDCNNS